MVLYHAISSYHLLEMIGHRKVFHSDDKAVLIISHTLAEKYPQCVSSMSFFDEVYVYDFVPPFTTGQSLRDRVLSYFDVFFKKYNYSINEFDTIYAACTHYFFGIYLVEKNIPFVFFEDGPGLLSTPERLSSLLQLGFPDITEYIYENGLYDGTNEIVIKRVCNVLAQQERYNDKKVDHFDIIEALLQFSESEQKNIISFFSSVDKIVIENDTIVLLTQHLASLKVLSFEDQCLIYQILIDYFFENTKIVFKPHPGDFLYYALLFPEATIIKEKFPSEFLPIIFTQKPKTIATISSTAVNNLYPYFDNIIAFDTQYEKDFKMTHRYYTAMKLLDALKFDRYDVFEFGANRLLLTNLDKCSDIHLNDFALQQECGLDEIPTGSITIIDSIVRRESAQWKEVIKFLNKTTQEDVVVFVNSQSDYCFYDIAHLDIFENIIPICIHKNPVEPGEDFYADCSEEIIYFYSKNRGYRNMAQELQFEKELAHTQVGVSVERLSAEQMKMKVLEGILSATEKRLLHYIQREKELTEELRKYKPKGRF